MNTPQQIKLELAQFIGSQTFTRYNPILFPNVVITEGVEYLADECGAYWLLDVVSSHLPSIPADEYFVIAVMTKDGDTARFALQDDVPPNTTYAEQTIEYTDFPLDSIKLYVAHDGEYWTILLPSEY